jgi:hypothetical protein
MIDLIRMTINQGMYMLRSADSTATAARILAAWQPHLVIFDADLEGKQVMDIWLAAPRAALDYLRSP